MPNSQLPDKDNLATSPNRIAVIGTAGAGKTVLAKRIAEQLALPHVELDAYRHGPDWTETPDDVFKEQISQALRDDAWIADGNYTFAREVVWPRAQMVVWLDYPITIVMWRLFWRTLKRSILREELWNGNREKLWRHVLSRQSLFLWALQTHWLRRRTIPAALGLPKHSHIRLVHLRSPGDAERWLTTLARVPDGAQEAGLIRR